MLMHISITKQIPGARQCWDTAMLSFHKLLLTSLASALACITINASNAEVASVYGGSDGLCGSRTANGERVNCSAMTAAHRTLPFGSRVTVCHHGCIVVRINDRGPFVPGRHIDLTPAAARRLTQPLTNTRAPATSIAGCTRLLRRNLALAAPMSGRLYRHQTTLPICEYLPQG
jgi:hypothetical protein